MTREKLRAGGYSTVYSTFGDRAAALRASRTLVEERLAACANLFSLDSVYCWKGRVHHEPEVGVFIKTRRALVPRLISRLRTLHPYENPCAVEIPLARGRSQYLDWIDDCTAPVRAPGQRRRRSRAGGAR